MTASGRWVMLDRLIAIFRRFSMRILPSLLALACSAALFGCQQPAPPADSSPPPVAEPAPVSAPAAQSIGAAEEIGKRLVAVIAGEHRAQTDRARDAYRHPLETLQFFGVAPDATVIEITPGGGWYSDILAPYLRAHGHFIAAIWDESLPDQPDYYARLNQQLADKIAAAPEVYGEPELRRFNARAPSFGAPASADVVLTFRNAHNWIGAGNAEAYFKAFFEVLKPGGTLGVVDHRAKPGTDLDTMKKSGYLTEALVIGLATRAGFVLDARSEVNANPADSADHPNGVWTLPPTNRHEATDAEKYRAIGESDRMTLRFRKPASE